MTVESQQAVTFLGVEPYLYYADGDEALAWLSSVVGFVEDVRYVDPDGRVAEAEMLAGDARIMIGGGHAPGADEGRGQLLVVRVDDVDAHHARVTAAGVGAGPPEDRPYGARTYTLGDPGGYRWCFWQGRGDVRLDEGWKEIRP